jgi:hypothetical protein
MYTFQEKGVVRVQVGVLNKDKSPYTTDLVFDTLGYDITFSLEPVDFVPAEAPMEEHNAGSDNGNGIDNKPRNGPDQSQMKKQKTVEGKQSENFTNSNGPVPMQLALTPFPPNVDVAKVLAVLKEKAGSTGNALHERKKFQNTYMRRSATPIKKYQDERTKEFPCTKEKQRQLILPIALQEVVGISAHTSVQHLHLWVVPR